MAEKDTAIQAGESHFPQTAWSLLSRLRDPKDPRVQEYLNRMISVYWRPIYKFVRIAWKRSNEDAKDLTQAFFIHLLEGEILARADPERGNFRKLLLASLRNFLSNEARSGHAQKRGGGRIIVSLDAGLEEGGAADPEDPQEAFESQWSRELLERAIEKLSKTVARPSLPRSSASTSRRWRSARSRPNCGPRRRRVGHHLQDARTVLRRPGHG